MNLRVDPQTKWQHPDCGTAAHSGLSGWWARGPSFFNHPNFQEFPVKGCSFAAEFSGNRLSELGAFALLRQHDLARSLESFCQIRLAKRVIALDCLFWT